MEHFQGSAGGLCAGAGSRSQLLASGTCKHMQPCSGAHELLCVSLMARRASQALCVHCNPKGGGRMGVAAAMSIPIVLHSPVTQVCPPQADERREQPSGGGALLVLGNPARGDHHRQARRRLRLGDRPRRLRQGALPFACDLLPSYTRSLRLGALAPNRGEPAPCKRPLRRASRRLLRSCRWRRRVSSRLARASSWELPLLVVPAVWRLGWCSAPHGPQSGSCRCARAQACISAHVPGTGP